MPPSITSGSIVDITVSQNYEAERRSRALFATLQSRILETYGLRAPSAPVLRLRNATQTSLVLEWDPVQLATSALRSLALYRNGSKAGNIPKPLEMLCTKISGLAIATEYSFYLVLKTSGGTYQSNTLTVKTHKMTDLTGITVTPGVMPAPLRDSLEKAVERIGAKIVDTVRIDTTHFVCTEGRGRDWERAVEMNIPVVRPEWIEGCERESKIVGVRGYYLDANPKHRQIGSNPALTQNQGPAAQSPPPATPASQTSQASLPSRPAEKGAEVQGEGPGPEAPPTPPPKNDLPKPTATAPAPQVAVSRPSDEESERANSPMKAAGGDQNQSGDGDEDQGEEDEGEGEGDEEDENERRSRTPPTRHRATVEEVKSDEDDSAEEEMEDVAL